MICEPSLVSKNNLAQHWKRSTNLNKGKKWAEKIEQRMKRKVRTNWNGYKPLRPDFRTASQSKAVRRIYGHSSILEDTQPSQRLSCFRGSMAIVSGDDDCDDFDKDYDDEEDRMQKTIVIWARLWVWVNRWVEGCDDDKIRYMIRIMANIGHNGCVFVAKKKSRTCARLLFTPHRPRHPAKVSFRFFRSSQITLRVARWQ